MTAETLKKGIKEPFTLIIFGAAGNLAKEKLFPALFMLKWHCLLPNRFSILGIDKIDQDQLQFRRIMDKQIRKYLSIHKLPQRHNKKHNKSHKNHKSRESKATKDFTKRLFYLRSDVTEKDFSAELVSQLKQLEDGQVGNRIFYLAVQPELFPGIIETLNNLINSQNVHNGKAWTRLVIEKPFGRDMSSAIQLDKLIEQYKLEDSVYRIDHYLGKETVMNILNFRFLNRIFEQAWNKEHIEHIQITASEDKVVDERLHYYDSVGALRDMVQNHLLQLLCLIAMEPPTRLDAPNEILKKKVDLLKVIQPCVENALRAQYKGYKDEVEKKLEKSDSNTETAVLLTMLVPNDRWKGVPFYLLTGKNFPKPLTMITVQFKQVNLYNKQNDENTNVKNVLCFCIQPKERICIGFTFEPSDADKRLKTEYLTFDYQQARKHPEKSLGNPYERLMLDVFRGNFTLFAGKEWVEKSWEIVDQFTKQWNGKQAQQIEQYDPQNVPESFHQFLIKNGVTLFTVDKDSGNPIPIRRIWDFDGSVSEQ